MSNPDSFIDEVTEEVRRDRLFGYLRRYGWIALLAVAGIVGGAAWNEWQKAQARAAAEAFGDALLTALDAPDQAARQAALAAVPSSGMGGAAALAALIAEAEAVASPDAALRDAALARLRAAAADASLPPLWRDLAQLRLLAVPGGEPDAAARRAASVLSRARQVGRPVAGSITASAAKKKRALDWAISAGLLSVLVGSPTTRLLSTVCRRSVRPYW